MLEDLFGSFRYEISALLEHPLKGEFEISLNSTRPVDVGSAFKVIIAYLILDDVSHGRLGLMQSYTIKDSHRVPDSSIIEQLPDGSNLTLIDLLHAMMSVSDNTATEILLEKVDTGRIRSLLKKLNMRQTTIPPSMRAIVDSIEQGSIQPMDVVICRSSVTDMNRFYMFLHDRIRRSALPLQVMDIMKAEDASQETQWPKGVSSLRKSGFVDLESKFSAGVSGIVFHGDDKIAYSVYSSIAPKSVDEFKQWTSVHAGSTPGG